MATKAENEGVSEFKEYSEKLPSMMALILVHSKLYWAAFEAFKMQGFSDAQALEILKARGVVGL